jgi:hypothetical protein
VPQKTQFMGCCCKACFSIHPFRDTLELPWQGNSGTMLGFQKTYNKEKAAVAGNNSAGW